MDCLKVLNFTNIMSEWPDWAYGKTNETNNF